MHLNIKKLPVVLPLLQIIKAQQEADLINHCLPPSVRPSPELLARGGTKTGQEVFRTRPVKQNEGQRPMWFPMTSKLKTKMRHHESRHMECPLIRLSER